MGMGPSSNLGRSGMPTGSDAHRMGTALAQMGSSTPTGAAGGFGSPDTAATKPRMKSKYPDPDSPSSATGSPIRPTAGMGVSRVELMVGRLTGQFRHVPESRVRELIRAIGSDKPGAISDRVRDENVAAERRAASSSSFGMSNSGVGLPKATKATLNGQAFSTAQQIAAQLSGATSTPGRPGQASSAAGTPMPAHRPAPKPKKNENSRIYANRAAKANKKSRKRDPDESEESAEELDDDEEEEEGDVDMGGGSGSDSEAAWSGDDKRKKKKRRTYADPDAESEEDEEGAEGVALKAFNEDTAEMITGTICAYSLRMCHSHRGIREGMKTPLTSSMHRRASRHHHQAPSLHFRRPAPHQAQQDARRIRQAL